MIDPVPAGLAALVETLLVREGGEGGEGDSFFARRLRAAGITERLSSMAEFQRLPFCDKAELLADRSAQPPFGSMLTEPLPHYTRFCQTSGTSTGQPMVCLDTPQSWAAMLRCWSRVYEAAGLRPGVDRVFFAFSFGPFLGFWTAFEAAAQHYMALPGGGLSTIARLETMARCGATVLCCTPTYALRLGETIGTEGAARLEQLAVRKIIVAGEPGGSVPAVRARIESLWGGARVLDHHGMTEVGPVTFESLERPGFLEVITDAYHAEVIDPQTLSPTAPGQCGELVLTTLTRTACPLLRYRTGDWVLPQWEGERLLLAGGVLGRCDDMLVIRGVNLYPSAVEAQVRAFPEIAEYRVQRRKVNGMDELELVVELQPGYADPSTLTAALEAKLRGTFALRIPVHLAAPGQLERFEFKAKRWLV
jgi:phenylacetate-CoA ligase